MYGIDRASGGGIRAAGRGEGCGSIDVWVLPRACARRHGLPRLRTGGSWVMPRMVWWRAVEWWHGAAAADIGAATLIPSPTAARFVASLLLLRSPTTFSCRCRCTTAWTWRNGCLQWNDWGSRRRCRKRTRRRGRQRLPLRMFCQQGSWIRRALFPVSSSPYCIGLTRHG